MPSNIQSSLEFFFDQSILDIAQSLGYSEENILILSNKSDELQEKFPSTMANLFSCSHHRDMRSVIEYGQTLILSWILEDYILLNLRLLNANIETNGSDKLREILEARHVTTDSDYIIEFDNKKILVEFATDYTGYWLRKLKIDLRDNKFQKIRSSCSEFQKSLLLGLDIKNKKFFCLDVCTTTSVTKISSHWPYGGKPAVSIALARESFIDFSFQNIKEHLFR
jgi:hypothetical protein